MLLALRRNRALPWGRCVLVTVLLCLASLGAGLPAQMLKGPYLIYPGANTEMQVLWQLDATVTCVIEWGQDTTYSDGSSTTTEYGTDHQHTYVIPGLVPGTLYHYRVTYGQSLSATGTFRTAPATNADSVKFLAYAESRTFPANHDAVNAEMISTYQADPLSQTFTLHAGDWVYGGDNESAWATEFFDPQFANTHELQANLPIQGCRGNHEQTGMLYAKYWPYPYAGIGGFYWSFDYGPVHVAIVDQYVSYAPGSAQYVWLDNDLATTTRPWKVIVFHEPGWSAGGTHPNNVDVQNYIHPLCLAHGVQLVISGHNHYYARCEVQGVTHLTIGGGGAPLRTVDLNSPYVVTAASVYHFCEFDIQAGTLAATIRGLGSTIVDSFTITPGLTDHHPLSETPALGKVYGVLADAASSDDVYQSIEEKHSGGPPATRYSQLEHTWNFDIIAGSAVTFFLEAHRSPVADPDDFVFSYSTDNLNFTPMLTVTKTIDDGQYQSFALPTSLSGPVQVRVEDTDRTAGNLSFDLVSVDDLFIRVIPLPPAPGSASAPAPVTGAVDVPLGALLSWTAGPGAQQHDVYFGTVNPPPFVGSQAGTTFDPGPLLPQTVYYWAVDEVNGGGGTPGAIWSFITENPCNPISMHVASITLGVVDGATGQIHGFADVMVIDDCGNPVPLASVIGFFTGDCAEVQIVVTDAAGVAHFVTSGHTVQLSFKFGIDEIFGISGLVYHPNQNVQSSAKF